jgi:hypothetical protein
VQKCLCKLSRMHGFGCSFLWVAASSPKDLGMAQTIGHPALPTTLGNLAIPKQARSAAARRGLRLPHECQDIFTHTSKRLALSQASPAGQRLHPIRYRPAA